MSDILSARMERLKEQHNRATIFKSSYYVKPLIPQLKEPNEELIHETLINDKKKKKIDVDLLDYDELINTIIKKKPNENITRKILNRYVDEAEHEYSD